MRRIIHPLEHLLARAVRTESGCLILPNRTDDPRVRPTVKVHGKTVKAARFVFESAHGSTEEYVLHTCDNPHCFELDHLYSGSQSRNMLDMYERNRRGDVDTRGSFDRSGPNNPNWKGGVSQDMTTYHRNWRERQKDV